MLAAAKHTFIAIIIDVVVVVVVVGGLVVLQSVRLSIVGEVDAIVGGHLLACVIRQLLVAHCAQVVLDASRRLGRTAR